MPRAIALNPMPLVNPLHRFALFTNAKCGGTTMKMWFISSLDLERSMRGPLSLLRHFGVGFAFRRYGLHRSLYDLPAHVLLSDVPSARRFITQYRRQYCRQHLDQAATRAWFKFAVVRNPFDRLLSGFLDKFCGTDRSAPWVERVLAEAGTTGAHGRRISFRQFVDYLAHADEHTVNPHWRRQTYILENFEIDLFVRLEHLVDDMRAVHERLGLAELEAILRTRRQTTEYQPARSHAAGSLCDATSEDINRLRAATGSFPDRGSFYSPGIRRKVAAIFKADFDRLPYHANALLSQPDR